MCVCALCSTTAIPREDGCKTAYLLAVLDRQKAQPAAARILQLKTKKDEFSATDSRVRIVLIRRLGVRARPSPLAFWI
jgi:hypothetical protein